MDIYEFLSASKENRTKHLDPLRSDFEEYVFLWFKQTHPEAYKDLKEKFNNLYSQVYAARESEAANARAQEEFGDIPF